MMNREIKFRALCDYDDTNGMVYFEPAKCDNGVFCMPIQNNISHIDEYLSPLMQFTGLEDAEINGKEVWEGDIIENCDTKLLQIVYWDEQKAAWFCQYNESKRTVSLAHSLGNLNKVIGNIYENPNLLK